MSGGVLNLAGITVFAANNGVIEIPDGTQIKGITDLDDEFVNSASYDVSTQKLTIETSNGNSVTVDLSQLIGTASQDATALAIALG